MPACFLVAQMFARFAKPRGLAPMFATTWKLQVGFLQPRGSYRLATTTIAFIFTSTNIIIIITTTSTTSFAFTICWIASLKLLPRGVECRMRQYLLRDWYIANFHCLARRL
jgi:hypothetical protein